jgi:hypothetical protein
MWLFAMKMTNSYQVRLVQLARRQAAVWPYLPYNMQRAARAVLVRRGVAPPPWMVVRDRDDPPPPYERDRDKTASPPLKSAGISPPLPTDLSPPLPTDLSPR